MFKQCLALNPTPNPVFELITGNNAIAPFKLQTTPRTKLGRIHLINGDSHKAIKQFTELNCRECTRLYFWSTSRMCEIYICTCTSSPVGVGS